MSATYLQPYTLGDILVAEVQRLTRDTVSFASGAAYVIGQVLGRRTIGAATSAAKTGGNTGNGACTLDATTPILANAQVGTYAVRCIVAAANGGTFRVTGPDGRVLGDVAVAATFANQIKFVIADGAADFVVGDGFDVTIAEGDGVYAPLNPTAVNGTQYAVAISGIALESSASVQKGIVIGRAAAVVAALLTWPDGISAGEKSKGLARLEARLIVARDSN